MNKAETIEEKLHLLDALNIIDEQAEQGGGDIEEKKAREKAYILLADFIERA